MDLLEVSNACGVRRGRDAALANADRRRQTPGPRKFRAMAPSFSRSRWCNWVIPSDGPIPVIQRKVAFASAASASRAAGANIVDSRRPGRARPGPIVSDAADGGDGVFGRPAHPDDARPGSTFTTEGDFDAEGTQSRPHPPKAAGECPGIFRPAEAAPGKVSLNSQEICGAAHPGGALSHDLPHASGHRIGVDDVFDRGPTVHLVCPRECAGGPERCFARRRPDGEICHPRQPIEAHVWPCSQTVARRIKQGSQEAGAGKLELPPKLVLRPALRFRYGRKGQKESPVGKIGTSDDVLNPVENNRSDDRKTEFRPDR
jgi:hypothetical protein